ncbi:MAG: hypothetical protein LBN00_06400 [Oscillospiraceae bacterium]|jgi:hypothetical protein|nr:hypothetical protein [Oscillospiraceae bacterium]
MSRKPKFEWNAWDYDGDGNAYIIRKDLCPNKAEVPKFIVDKDYLSPECLNPELGAHLSEADVISGWCKYQVRTDWLDGDGTPRGGYVVEDFGSKKRLDNSGKNLPGWFEVWIVRVGEWY